MVTTQNHSKFVDSLEGLSHKSLAKTILSAINYPDQVYGLSQSLKCIENLIPYLKAVNPANVAIWDDWALGIPFLINVAQNIESDIVTKPNANKKNRWLGKISTYKISLLAAIEQPLQYQSDAAYVNPALAILLASYILKIADDDAIKNICDFVRKAANGNSEYLGLLKRYIPPLTVPEKSSWLQKTQVVVKPKKSGVETYRNGYPVPRNMIVYLYNNLWELEPELKPDSNKRGGLRRFPQQSPLLVSIQSFSEHSDSDVFLDAGGTQDHDLAGPTIRTRVKINLFQKHKPDRNLDVEGLEPVVAQMQVIEDTVADQPMQLASVQLLDVRYTNYRTAFDNQRLAWTWDCLNKFEIAALRVVLSNHSKLENALAEDKVGAFLTWIMLLTGQNIKQILQFNLFNSPDHQSALMSGCIYRRYIHAPPHSFKPNDQQKTRLSVHADYINLPLPKPFPHLINELGLSDLKVMPINNYQTVSSSLGLSEESAEQEIRQFLLKHRSRNIRFSIGRVRNVLAAEIMRETSDPVVVHILTSIPSDMPPSGVYYTSFSEGVLGRIYEGVMKSILGEG